MLQEWKDGKFVEKESDEDIHTANERRLAELIGPVAGTCLAKINEGTWLKSRTQASSTPVDLGTIKSQQI